MQTGKVKILVVIVLLLLLVPIGILIRKYSIIGALKMALHAPGKEPAHTKDKDEKKTTYYCPMHPSFVSDKPGNCPICQMSLVPMHEAPSGEHTMTAKPEPVPAGGLATGASPSGLTSVNISPQRQQLLGIKMEEARVLPLTKTIRTVGMVAIDERRVVEVYPKISGWAEKVYVDATWQHVHKGEPLLEVYSPELVQTQEEYLLALRTRDSLAQSPFKEIASGGHSLLEAARRRLLLWDVTEAQIRDLEQRGKAARTMTIYSPMTGHVMQRDVFPSKRVEPNMKLYTIVDHSVVWVNVDIFENDIAYLRPGQHVKMTVISYPGEVFHGRTSFIWPHMDEKTRTLKARLEFANPGLKLKPEMYTNVEIEVSLGRQLTVPEDAVLDTGTQQYVFVDQGNGYFEPRKVKPGARADGRFAILEGLKPGERIVTAANFLLDSESRLKGAFVDMGAPQTLPAAPQTLPAAPQTPPAARPAEQLRIELHTESMPAKVGDNRVRVHVADAQGAPITEAAVRVTISMPAMGAMPAMRSEAKLTHQGNGNYSGVLNIPMAWTWQATVTVERGGKVLGTAHLDITAK
jgi:RND family efflux transporter MFP subunit